VYANDFLFIFLKTEFLSKIKIELEQITTHFVSSHIFSTDKNSRIAYVYVLLLMAVKPVTSKSSKCSRSPAKTRGVQ